MAVSIKCIHCGAVIKSAKDFPAGAKVKCPKCAKPFVVEGATEKKKPAAEPTPDAGDNPFATMGPGDPETLTKHKVKKSPLKMILFGCGFLLLLSCCCGAGGAGWYFQDTVKEWVGANKDEAAKKVSEATAQVKLLTLACQAYSIKHNGAFPEQLSDLLVRDVNGHGPYMERNDVLHDPWGQPYQYDRHGPNNQGLNPDIWTVERDTGKKIGNWPTTVKSR